MKKISAIITLSLGLSFLNIIPAHAIPTQTGDLTVSSTATTLYTRVNTAVTTTVTVATAAAVTGGATARTLTMANETKPLTAAAQSANVTASTNNSFTFTTAGTLGTGYALTAGAASTKIAVSVTSASVYTLTPFAGDEVAITGTPTTAKIVGTVSFKPATAGVYTYSITPTAGAVHTITVVVNDAGDLTPTAAVVLGSTSATSTTATQAINNTVRFIYTEALTGANTVYITSDSKGSIISGTDDNGDLGSVNGTNLSGGALWTVANSAVETADLTITSSTAGTNVIKIQSLTAGTGLYTTIATLTITWLDGAASAGVSASQSTIYAIADSGTCTYGASKAGDVAAGAANADTKTGVATGTALDICIAPRNGNGDLVAITTSSTVISSLGASAALAAATSQQEDAFTGAASPTIGAATITAILIDNLGYSASISTTVTYWGTLSKLAIVPLVSAAYGAADRTTSGTNTYAGYVAGAAGTFNKLVVGLNATDAAGGTIDTAVSANSTATSAFTIDSDKVAGVPAARTSDALGASVAAMNVAGERSSSRWGSNAAYIDCSTKAEKLTITAFGKNSDGDWVASNSLDVHCSGAVATVTVKPVATSIAAGGTTTVNVDVKDANGYPVADNTSVTLTSSDGSSIAPSAKSTANGVFTTAANLVAGSNASNTIITAIAGGKSGAATVTITGGSSNSNINTRIDSLNSKIVALTALIAKIMKSLKIK